MMRCGALGARRCHRIHLRTHEGGRCHGVRSGGVRGLRVRRDEVQQISEPATRVGELHGT